jgi:uncharacterized protein YjiS (DUF1127 family)
VLPPIITPTRPYPCDSRRQAAGREGRVRLAASIVRLVAAAVREYQDRRAIRRLMERDDHLFRDIGVRRGKIERVVDERC